MRMYIYDTYKRATDLGIYMVEHNSTVRSTARHFGISKSTVHKDVTQRLKQLDPALYAEVSIVLEQNKNERHIRGGQATRLKYKKEKC
ncbi:MAG: stage III sporulation protein D [Clostridiales bacterium GWF2_36_10]|nr:MAG: stage III sporulation protein D [Clostridiales bacterium GWF2_36_10]HAN21886.1 stage III sporulation protein D [Clostridiales bacterium]